MILIKLNNFTKSASSEIGIALKEMKATGKLKGLILDIRGNPGGLLNEAVNVSNIFIEKGKEIDQAIDLFNDTGFYS